MLCIDNRGDTVQYKKALGFLIKLASVVAVPPPHYDVQRVRALLVQLMGSGFSDKAGGRSRSTSTAFLRTKGSGPALAADGLWVSR